MKKINSLLISFPDFMIGHHKINQFRREVIELSGADDDVFHNHTPTGGMITRYPEIQYRVNRNPETGKEAAAIWAVGDGVNALKNFVFNLDNVGFQSEPAQTEVGIVEKPIKYQIRHFLPFNDTNWEVYKKNQNVRQCLAQIEKILVGNILNFCTEIGYQIPNKSLRVEILDLKELGLKHCQTELKDNLYLMAFDVIYEANIQLPPMLGLGRFKAKGYGWQVETNKTHLKSHTLRKRRELQKPQAELESI